MKKNAIVSLVGAALLLTGLFVNACTSNTGMEGSHQMGSARMSNAKMPGALPTPTPKPTPKP